MHDIILTAEHKIVSQNYIISRHYKACSTLYFIWAVVDDNIPPAVG